MDCEKKEVEEKCCDKQEDKLHVTLEIQDSSVGQKIKLNPKEDSNG